MLPSCTFWHLEEETELAIPVSANQSNASEAEDQNEEGDSMLLTLKVKDNGMDIWFFRIFPPNLFSKRCKNGALNSAEVTNRCPKNSKRSIAH